MSEYSNKVNSLIKEIVIQLFNEYSENLKSKCTSDRDNFTQKKNLIKSFERIMRTIRYYEIGEKELYKDITDNLEALQQLKDMRNQVQLFKDLMNEFLCVYGNKEQIVMIDSVFLDLECESTEKKEGGDRGTQIINTEEQKISFLITRDIEKYSPSENKEGIYLIEDLIKNFIGTNETIEKEANGNVVIVLSIEKQEGR